MKDFELWWADQMITAESQAALTAHHKPAQDIKYVTVRTDVLLVMNQRSKLCTHIWAYVNQLNYYNVCTVLLRSQGLAQSE